MQRLLRAVMVVLLLAGTGRVMMGGEILIGGAQALSESEKAMVLNIWQEANNAFAVGQLQDAIKGFSYLSEILPMPAPFINLAICYEKLGQFPEAGSTFDSAMAKFPDSHETHMAACRFGAGLLNRQMHNIYDAKSTLVACGTALRLKPDDVESIIMYGSTLVLVMDFAEAARVLKQALPLVQNDRETQIQVLSNLALAYLRGGFQAETLATAQKMQELFPHEPRTDTTVASARTVLVPYDQEVIDIMRRSIRREAATIGPIDPACTASGWSVAINWTEAEHIPSLRIRPISDPSKEPLVDYGSVDLLRQAEPAAELEIRSQFRERAVVFVEMPAASLWGLTGILAHSCTILAASLQWELEVTPLSQLEPRFVQTVTITDPVVSTLPLKNLKNYYHWLCEGLPRALWAWHHTLQENPAAKLLVPTLQPFMQQSLELRDTLLQRIGPSSASPIVVYVSRSASKAVRSVLNEDDVIGQCRDAPRLLKRFALLNTLPSNVLIRHCPPTIATLEATVSALGQRLIVHRGTESLREQLALFAQARVVVAAHGAGVSNTIVCGSGTQVVLLPMWPMVDHTFVHLAAALDHEIILAPSVRSYYYGNFGSLTSTQLEELASATRQAIQAADWAPTVRRHPDEL
ncbi:uncharacterized protein MONBRDRAFT_26928 [Monosiga brevicollis MX1]|uniref:Glycosyltransferase 61 catalytic domain-containing protein n=1 Tax=Monosiga brevicollis TaxID=81824 RepID=A9V3Y2_MONBE|nr:uncharacterized protein MONBRDRAFT_26928 [Monosiga brevicollis MX1]EDQ87789.1 predicted protein [Monosiga brevicollis MX1]|eukprot:XP_001747322.1 hypothetical protein [Monosiga brevicollis MX1]